MKKLFLLLLFLICSNIQVNAMGNILSSCPLPQTIEINDKEIPKEVVKTIIRRLIQEQPSLAKEKHRETLCIITNLLVRKAEEKILLHLQITKIRNAKRDSPGRLLESIEPGAIQAGNQILEVIFEVLAELE